MIGVLNDYAQQFGDGREIEYTIRKRFGGIEIRIIIPGEIYDPFENGNGSEKRKIEKILNLNLNSQAAFFSHLYIAGRNIVIGSVPLDRSEKSLLKDPTTIAILLGVLVGIICLHLPETASHFIIDDLMDPVMNVLLSALTGIMGPVIFFSLVTSISTIDSIDNLTNMGSKIFKRFVVIILSVIGASIGVSMLFFGDFGSEGLAFSPDQIVTMLLNIIPVNLIQPFLENNTPQMLALAFLGGISLLLAG